MPAGPHVWVTSAARGPTSRVSWLYAHISELPDDSSRIARVRAEVAELTARFPVYR